MYKQGDIVLIPIPFMDLTSSKKRPVLILSNDSYHQMTVDIIVVAVTSNVDEKNYIVDLTSKDLSEGTLLKDSCVRAEKIYTLAQSIVIKKFGHVKSELLEKVNEKVVEVLRIK